MSTAPCERCGDPAPEPLLRRVELRVDGDSVDDQTLCPDCFSEWVSRYQAEMAGDMPEPESEDDAGDDITIAEETEPTPDIGTGSNALDETVASAENRAESSAQSEAREQRSDLASHPTDGGGDDIREVGDEAPQGPGTGDGEVEIDLDADTEYSDDEDEEDDGGLL